MDVFRLQSGVYFLEPELLGVSIGSGKTKTVAMAGEARSMRFRIGPLLVLVLLPMSFGITVPKISIVLGFKEWFVFFFRDELVSCI